MPDLIKSSLMWLLSNYGSYVAMGVIALLGGGMLLGSIKGALVKLFAHMFKGGDRISRRLMANPRMVSVGVGIAASAGLGAYAGYAMKPDVMVDRPVEVEVVKTVQTPGPIQYIEKTLEKLVYSDNIPGLIDVECPQCATPFKVKDAKEGEQRCAKCNKVNAVVDLIRAAEMKHKREIMATETKAMKAEFAARVAKDEAEKHTRFLLSKKQDEEDRLYKEEVARLQNESYKGRDSDKNPEVNGLRVSSNSYCKQCKMYFFARKMFQRDDDFSRESAIKRRTAYCPECDSPSISWRP